MMHKIVVPILIAGLVAAWSPVRAGAEATKSDAPAAQDTGALEVRATQSFAAGEWATALPLLKKVAERLKKDPNRLGQIEEQIRVCEKNLAKIAKAKAGDAPATTATPPAPNSPPPTGEQRKPLNPPKPGQALETGIKELGNFDYDQEKGGNIPEDVKKLSGSTVRVRGFMIPMDQADNITKFALVPDLFACCFGQPPQVQHMVVANCPEGKAVGYSPDEIVVEGKLNVEEKKDDGYIISIFEVSVASVKAAPR
jgi:hypothetical protein